MFSGESYQRVAVVAKEIILNVTQGTLILIKKRSDLQILAWKSFLKPSEQLINDYGAESRLVDIASLAAELLWSGFPDRTWEPGSLTALYRSQT